MDFDFTQTMQNASDEDLIKILTVDRDGYQEAAVNAAEIELAKRNLSTEKFESSKKDHEETRKIEIEKANAPLDNTTKIAVFFVPVVSRFLSRPLSRDGYDRKAAEVIKWSLFGLAFYMAIIVLVTWNS